MTELRELDVAELGQIEGGGDYTCVSKGTGCDSRGNNCKVEVTVCKK